LEALPQQPPHILKEHCGWAQNSNGSHYFREEVSSILLGQMLPRQAERLTGGACGEQPNRVFDLAPVGVTHISLENDAVQRGPVGRGVMPERSATE
jgi:hypothetical protein